MCIRDSYSPGLIIFKIKNASQAVLDSISDFEALESITFMPKYQVETDSIESENTVEIKTPTEGLEYPIVGVLDTGAVSYTHLDVYKRQIQ